MRLDISAACVVVLLVVGGRISAEDPLTKGSRNVSSTVVHVTSAPDWLEMELFGFRLWMIIGLVLVGIMIVVIALCCIFDCRIPRTKQDIQARIEREQAAKNAKIKDSRVEAPTETISVMSAGTRPYSATQRQAVAEHRHAFEIDRNPLANKAQSSRSRDSHVNGNFQLQERPYGRRLRYIPGKGLDPLDCEQPTGFRQFRADPRCTANTLASLGQQPYTKV